MPSSLPALYEAPCACTLELACHRRGCYYAGTLTFDYPTIAQIADWLVEQQAPHLPGDPVAAAIAATTSPPLVTDSLERLVTATLQELLGIAAIDVDAPLMASGARHGP